ncbi:J domain-containing protein [Candidatus Uabimicrobium amorphum]|uniref:Chaperone protein DnaJ n=1 Tax=Uabimicrobium amorphum TaxID=2596890 RepID=A0A5S9F575_UABAM|nr:J domain-containing protein [Candidatus Uabimicrobium amorphum]BBM86312.1 chaperone protein DnaJ [Candidatus Uabimicrobium amorphum]
MDKLQKSSANYYDILGISVAADIEQIRKRYRILALENHPDKFRMSTEKQKASERFKAIRMAYDVLSNIEKRNQYDICLRTGKEFTNVHNSNDPLEPSLGEILSDIDRYQFPQQARNMSEGLKEFVDKSIIRSESFQEKIIDVLSIKYSEVETSPVASITGEVAEEKFILTNLRFIVARQGRTSFTQGKTMYSQSSYGGYGKLLLDIEKIVLLWDVRRNSKTFDIAFYGTDLPLSGIYFTIAGSFFSFLWIAELYDIEFELQTRFMQNPDVGRKISQGLALLGSSMILLPFVLLPFILPMILKARLYKYVSSFWWEVASLFMIPLVIHMFYSRKYKQQADISEFIHKWLPTPPK